MVETHLDRHANRSELNAAQRAARLLAHRGGHHCLGMSGSIADPRPPVEHLAQPSVPRLTRSAISSPEIEQLSTALPLEENRRRSGGRRSAGTGQRNKSTQVRVPQLRQVFAGAAVQVSPGRRFGRRIHDLRHTTACLWLARGADVVTVQARMGHASVATTNLYLHHLGTSADRAGLDRLTRRGARSTPESDEPESQGNKA